MINKESLKKELKKSSSPHQAAVLQRFFKTGKGEYGEGDIFLGIKMPELRKLVKRYKDLNISDVLSLLESKIHEYRMTALLILVAKFNEGNEREKKKIFNLYLKNTKYINNWDLIDVTVAHIVGAYLFDKDRAVLYKLAKSKNLWERRIAIIATHHFIRNDDFYDTLTLAELLVDDNHDLIHKAVGWMLREVGKKDLEVEEVFLRKHYKTMPRTMLRYAIERFAEEKRMFYMGK